MFADDDEGPATAGPAAAGPPMVALPPAGAVNDAPPPPAPPVDPADFTDGICSMKQRRGGRKTTTRIF